jgi:hypothetical protein
MSDTVSGGGVLKKTKRVFLASGTAYEGYAVCYNFDAKNVTAEDDPTAITFTLLVLSPKSLMVLLVRTGLQYMSRVRFVRFTLKRLPATRFRQCFLRSIPGKC